jgi:hypothetical protein
MESKLSEILLTGWFERLVKNGMAAVAVVFFGITISCFLLTFSKLFEEVEHYVIFYTGAILLPSFGILLFYTACMQVNISLNASALANRRKGTRKSQKSQANVPCPDGGQGDRSAEGPIAQRAKEGIDATIKAAKKKGDSKAAPLPAPPVR